MEWFPKDETNPKIFRNARILLVFVAVGSIIELSDWSGVARVAKMFSVLGLRPSADGDQTCEEERKRATP